MSFWDFARGPASVRLMLEFGAERGLGAPQLLAGSHVTPQQLADPNAQLLASQELHVAENLLRLLGRPPGLGLEVGARYQFSTFGMWGYGIVSSATLGAALDLALRFLPLTYGYSVIEFVRRGDEGVLSFGEPDLPAGLRRFVMERDISAAAQLLQQLGGNEFRLLWLRLKSGRGRAHLPSRVVEHIGGVAPDYGGDSYALSFDLRQLARKLPHADPTTVAMCERMCAQLMEQRRLQLGMAASVRQQLKVCADATLPSLSRFAQLCGTTERTLKRRLQQEGTSFRKLVAQTQAESAARLVVESEMPLTIIAERLGYSDLSSFSQAFKRWHGVSPAAFRVAAAAISR